MGFYGYNSVKSDLDLFRWVCEILCQNIPIRHSHLFNSYDFCLVSIIDGGQTQTKSSLLFQFLIPSHLQAAKKVPSRCFNRPHFSLILRSTFFPLLLVKLIPLLFHHVVQYFHMEKDQPNENIVPNVETKRLCKR